MSFVKTKKLMEEGDTVLLYLGYDNLEPVILARGAVTQNRYGAVKHDRLIGAPYGVKVDCPKGWLYPLQATSELWTLALPHRTQILYSPDISMVVFLLDLKPGSVVVEAGTGSGSLSHALLRSVQPSGRLHTFEFHKGRSEAARKEFERHGLGAYVTAEHRDVCADGFVLVEEADAVFLDLPSPWECIGHAKKALKTGGRLCSFSPCMEQVQRTCEALRHEGFTDLKTLECLARPFSVQRITLPTVDFGDTAPSSGTDHQGPQGQEGGGSDGVTVDRTGTDQKDFPVEDGATEEDHSSKRARLDESGRCEAEKTIQATTAAQTSTNATVESKEFNKVTGGRSMGKGREEKGRVLVTGAPPESMQGHTGFLTFASLH